LTDLPAQILVVLEEVLDLIEPVRVDVIVTRQ